MVDVSAKLETARVARARACVLMDEATRARIDAGQVSKGDVLAVARLAGITAAKRTSDLIPLCHPLRLTSVELELKTEPGRVLIESTVRAHDRTGVEMEALVAASTAALTVYDMCKAVDRWMTNAGVQLLDKSGGKSGHLVRPQPGRQGGAGG